jgi:hypothetical protein
MDVNRVKHGFKALISQIRTFGDRNPAFTMRLHDQFDADRIYWRRSAFYWPRTRVYKR